MKFGLTTFVSLNFRSLSASVLSSVSSRAMSTFSSDHELVLDKFALRQFNNADYTGTQVNYDETEFEKQVNKYYREGAPLVDGYAPFW